METPAEQVLIEALQMTIERCNDVANILESGCKVDTIPAFLRATSDRNKEILTNDPSVPPGIFDLFLSARSFAWYAFVHNDHAMFRVGAATETEGWLKCKVICYEQHPDITFADAEVVQILGESPKVGYESTASPLLRALRTRLD